jgi:hypothetical protein
MLGMLDRCQIARDAVTLVFDKGSAALANTVVLQEAGVGWISALPWNQAPVAFRERAVEQLPLCSSAQPGVRAAAEKLLVHGQEYLCVLKYSASFVGEQLHSLTTSLSKVLQALRRFSMELNKPQARWKENQIRSKIQRWLSGPFLEELIRYQIESSDGRWRLQFEFDTAAWQRLVDHRLVRTLLLSNRMDLTAEQVAMGYSGQQEVERVFRGLKDGDWLGWGPMYHWTDRKIRIHACFDGIYAASTVPVLFSSGDIGGVTQYPCTSPNVVCVGGTSLVETSTSHRNIERGWSFSGGGCSPFEVAPGWQFPYSSSFCGGSRGAPDIAGPADPNTGALVYYSPVLTAGLYLVGGTSWACPVNAAIVLLEDAARAAAGMGRLGGPATGNFLAPDIYLGAANPFYRYRYYDVTTGSNGFPTVPGWDRVTELGVEMGPALSFFFYSLP